MKKDFFILALDLDDKRKILNLVEQTKDYVGTYKIGPRLFLKEGPNLIDEIRQKALLVKFFWILSFMIFPPPHFRRFNRLLR